MKDYYFNGVLEFEGEYINGKRNGKGKEYYCNGKLEFEGEFLNDKRNGEGKDYYDDDTLEFRGQYLNGERWNGKAYDKNGLMKYQIKNGKCIRLIN